MRRRFRDYVTCPEHIVRRVLKQAVVNGYESDLRRMTPDHLVADLMRYDPECERLETHQVLAVAEEWLARRV